MSDFHATPENEGIQNSQAADSNRPSPAKSAKQGVPVKLWQSLDEYRGGDPGAKQRSLPNPLTADPLSRKQFLQLMGASLALGGFAVGCSPEHKGPQQIAPYVRRPVGVTEDLSLFYASALTRMGFANGVLVRQVSGRPVKIEGNPQHPASLGATDIFGQAATLEFYDPDRDNAILNNGTERTWDDLVNALTNVANAHQGNQGQGIRILTETVTSPSLNDQIQALLDQFPNARWHQWEPVNRDNVLEGARQAFGEFVGIQYRLDQADVIVTLDSDVLNGVPGSLRYAHDFAAKRRVTGNNMSQNRLYAIESTPSVTGMMADNRLPVRARDVEAVARAIAAGVGVGQAGSLPEGVRQDWIDALVQDLNAHRGTSVVIAGEAQPPAVHVLAHQINQALGNAGRTVIYTDPVEFNPTIHLQSLQELVQDMNAGQVDFLLMIGGNPAYNAPADLDFPTALGKVAESVHLSLLVDETSKLSTWHVPMAHELEAWGDARAFDGTATIIQPLIQPLYSGRTPQELLSVLNGQGVKPALDIVKAYWQQQLNVSNFDQSWATILSEGTVPQTTLAPKQVTPTNTPPPPTAAPAAQGLEILFRPDPTVFDGRYANVGWLQELPKPLTTVTWDNVAYFSPSAAQELGLSNEDVVELQYGGKTIEAPVWVLPGHPNGAVTVHLGYGRGEGGRLGTGIGYNAYPIRSSSALWFDGGLEVRKTGRRYTLAVTQGTQNMAGRHIVIHGTLDEFQSHPNFVQEAQHEVPGSLYGDFPAGTVYGQSPYRWAMSIDLTACIGCGACVVACQAENNIPVVGKEQVTFGRHMHWFRVDRYYEGDPANPTSYNMPVPCMHCETAPCEVVCPVAATVHSAEGLNDMVYNRCVGTRYCSNNCPYKVRRFNFLQYADYETPSLKMMYNPDVSVRERGVMEKCTYCVQRIRIAEVRAEREGRQIREGEVLTACQAACPTKAIQFGNTNNQDSQIAKLKQDVLNYDLLKELNTRPRTSYLAAIRNPNGDIKEV